MLGFHFSIDAPIKIPPRAATIIHVFQGNDWPKIAIKQEVSAQIIVGVFFNNGTTIAIKVKGIANASSQFSGIVDPAITPTIVEICHASQSVRPEPSMKKCTGLLVPCEVNRFMDTAKASSVNK